MREVSVTWETDWNLASALLDFLQEQPERDEVLEQAITSFNETLMEALDD